MNRLIGIALYLWAFNAVANANDGPFKFDFEELAPGVWAGVRADGPRFPVMGSVTFIISHWHGDHNFGIHRFAEEYPNVQFVAHRFTHAVMNGSRIQYIQQYPNFIENNLLAIKKALETGAEKDGTKLTESDRVEYARLIEDADEINGEYNRAKVTSPNMVFDDKLTIHSGAQRIELIKLGHGNTAGDILMWLADHKLVATGDLVVLPTPYAFNVPPRAWAATSIC